LIDEGTHMRREVFLELAGQGDVDRAEILHAAL
jgi:hypothetical protein